MTPARMLLRELVGNPRDRGVAAVLADWCEEQGFESAATGLRSEIEGPDFVRAVRTLQNLFEGASTYDRRDSVYTFATTEVTGFVLAGETIELHFVTPLTFRLCHLALPPEIAAACTVEDVHVGAVIVTRRVMGEMFLAGSAPVFASRTEPANTLVRVRVRNDSSDTLRRLSVTLLGVQAMFNDAPCATRQTMRPCGTCLNSARSSDDDRIRRGDRIRRRDDCSVRSDDDICPSPGCSDSKGAV